MISGTPVERVSSFKYLGVNISEDLTWTAHIQTQVKKKTVPSATAEEIQGLTSYPENFLFSGHRKCTDSVHLSVVWKCLQSGLQSSAESRALSWAHLRVCPPLSAGHLPSRVAKIIKDSNHPSNHLFILLPSGKHFRSMMTKTERLRRSFFPQAIRLLNSNSVS